MKRGKVPLLEALDLAEDHERVRRKKEFVLDFGVVQCGEFQKRSSC
jgi:hypothetical protein